MNLNYLISIILKKSVLIVGAGMLFAGIAYLIQSGKPVTYTSSTTLYAGRGCEGFEEDVDGHQGGPGDFIQLVRSRSTAGKTAIRLMAQHLVLAAPDPEFCMPSTWQNLRLDMPGEIRALADTLAKEDNPDTIREFQTVTDVIQRFRIKRNYYTIKAGDNPGSVSKRFGLKPGELERMNTPMPPFQGGRMIIVGTVQEPYLADTMVSVVRNPPGHEAPEVTATDRAGEDPRSLEVLPGYLRTVENLARYMDTCRDNYIANKLQSKDPIYGTAGISSVGAVTIRNSGFFRLTFRSIDPAVAVQTLKILTQVAGSEYQLLHTGPGSLVREYFAKKVSAARHQLDSLEQCFMDFNDTRLTLMKKEMDRRKASLAASIANGTVRPGWKWDYHCQYDEFGPMGGTLKQLDREINLAQQNYLNYLDNLNQCILKESWRTRPEIIVVDGPDYPAGPDRTGKFIWMLLAFVAGILAAGILVILYGKSDRMIRTPGRLEKLSGLRVIGTFPAMPENPDGKVNFPLLSTRAVDQVVQWIRVEEQQDKDRGEQPFVLFFISTREKEGKSYLASRITEKLRVTGSKVLYIKPREQKTGMEARKQFISFNQPGQAWDYEYSVPENFTSVKNINELLRNYAFLTKGYRFLIIELPALLESEYPATLVRSGNLAILVCQATRTWTHSDREAIRLYQAGSGHPVLGLLNFTAANENI